MKTLKEKEQLLLDDFKMLPQWEDRYNYIMDLGNELPLIDEKDKNQENKVEGCQSASWLKVIEKDGKLYFKGDSEAILGKGVISLLLNLLNGHKAEEIATYDFHLIKAIDLAAHLSPTRKTGLESVMRRIRELALKYLEK